MHPASPCEEKSTLQADVWKKEEKRKMKKGKRGISRGLSVRNTGCLLRDDEEELRGGALQRLPDTHLATRISGHR